MAIAALIVGRHRCRVYNLVERGLVRRVTVFGQVLVDVREVVHHYEGRDKL